MIFRRGFAAVVAVVLLGAAAAALPASLARAQAPAQEASAPPTATAGADGQVVEKAVTGVDIVFCIDVSGSMAQQMPRAKQAIRAIIQEAKEAYPAGTPIRLGLVRYGNADKTYFVQHLVPDEERFFRNLDQTQSVNCGAEYFGAAVSLAVDRLKWDASKDADRYLFLVGNETADQGPTAVSYRRTIPKAVKQGIRVSSLYCPAPRGATFHRQADPRYSEAYFEKQEARAVLEQELEHKTTWVDAAALGGGRFLQLDWKHSESPVLSWDPAQFRQALALVSSREFEESLAMERQSVDFNDWLNRKVTEAYLRRFGGGGGMAAVGRIGGTGLMGNRLRR